MKKYDPICKDFPHFLHGGDYNPEQWVDMPEIVDEDMRLMKEANCNEMTAGIFAWAEIEKEEGEFDFSLLDEVMDKVAQNGGKVVLATPSGARPVWLAEKYPEVLRVMENGKRILFGYRHNHCYTSPVYREKVRIIDEKLAERYANHPALAGWHLSNEYNGACYCDLCVDAFRKWLAEKYDHDIEKLNRAWWSRFWSHRYQRFDQINPPHDKYAGEGGTNGHNLDWKRFISHQTVDFAKNEADAVRKYSDKAITTNCMGIFAGYNHRDMAEVLDVYSNDFYPAWWRDTLKTAQKTAFDCALCRGMKHGKPFMVMESAPGINQWSMNFSKQKSNEEQLLEAFLFIANGADTLQYFQWRKGRGSGEKFHGAVVDHYGKSDTRVFQNVKKIGGYLKKMDGVIGTGIKADVALTYDWETRWALYGEPNMYWSDEKNGYEETAQNAFNALWNKNVAADIVGYDIDFSKYKVVFMPAPYLMNEGLADKMKEYVKNGGTLVSTYLTAVADDTDLCFLGGVPGLGLRELFGLRTEEVNNYKLVGYGQIGENSVLYNGKSYTAERIAEVVIPEGAETVAAYETDYFKGSPAVMKHAFGKGTAYYVAFQPNEEFLTDFMQEVAKGAGVKTVSGISADEHVSVSLREGDGEKYYFVMNCSKEEKKIILEKPLYNLLEGKEEHGEITVSPMGIRLFFEKE